MSLEKNWVSSSFSPSDFPLVESILQNGANCYSLLRFMAMTGLSLTAYHLPMQFQKVIEYQRFADRWFKFCVRVALDPVSALNLWWNSGSSFGFGLNDAIPVAF